MDPNGAERSGWVRKASGWTMLAIGIAGCVLPVLPGIPIALAGLIILARDYSWARSAVRKAKRKLVSLRRRTRSKPSDRESVTVNAGSANPVPASEPDPLPGPLP